MENIFCRSPSGDAHYNLAMDEHLLDAAGPGELYLYFYVNTGAVIIGRNQNPWNECDLDAMARGGVQLTRR
ncbi:MAG: lipoate--protein ligase, partial [Oscillospiraceae bacterium]|nr:lipoate--protein ligase [Oscillospiraceae bacterium]